MAAQVSSFLSPSQTTIFDRLLAGGTMQVANLKIWPDKVETLSAGLSRVTGDFMEVSVLPEDLEAIRSANVPDTLSRDLKRALEGKKMAVTSFIPPDRLEQKRLSDASNSREGTIRFDRVQITGMPTSGTTLKTTATLAGTGTFTLKDVWILVASHGPAGYLTRVTGGLFSVSQKANGTDFGIGWLAENSHDLEGPDAGKNLLVEIETALPKDLILDGKTLYFPALTIGFVNAAKTDFTLKRPIISARDPRVGSAIVGHPDYIKKFQELNLSL